MTVINGKWLDRYRPVEPWHRDKMRLGGVSFGLAESGYDIRIHDAVTLHPLRRFALAYSFERFEMPPILTGIVHDKSTWARQGLSVFNTVIEPGWRGFLTLELVYHGMGILRIPPGVGIAQVIFHEVQDVSRGYEGKYQDQAAEAVPARFD